MKRLRIVHALASYELGGGEMLALRLASYQRREGHEVHVVALSDAGPLRERFEEADVRTELVVKRAGFDATLFPRLWALFARRRGLLPRQSPALVVHTHNPQSLVYAAPAAKAALAQVVHTKHGEAVEGRRAFRLRQGAARFVDAFVSVSRQTDAFAREHREAPRGRLHVIENGVELAAYGDDPQRRAGARAELGVDDETFVVGTVGRLQPVKNQALLLRAAAPLLSAAQKAKLVLVGDGPELAALQSLASELGVAASVVFLGYQQDVARWLAAFDCFAMSSHTEGLPLVLIEAMASGLPTVCTAVGGIPAAVGSAGRLVEAGDEAALAAALAGFAADRAAARALGVAGRARVEELYAFSVMAERYEQLYSA
ncbi:MAG: glycogen synthase [Proteobacteria bacterium]|nr:MAG: glycogen synthase [Pseudomonadota bacterium]